MSLLSVAWAMPVNSLDELISHGRLFENYSFIEVMACPGGCIGGGGQPKVKLPQVKKVQQARMDSLYQSDVDATYKASWEYPEIQDLYNNSSANLFPNVLK